MNRICEIEIYPFCPTPDLSCPYYALNSGRCRMYDEEEVLPYGECDAFFGLDEDDYIFN